MLYGFSMATIETGVYEYYWISLDPANPDPSQAKIIKKLGNHRDFMGITYNPSRHQMIAFTSSDAAEDLANKVFTVATDGSMQEIGTLQNGSDYPVSVCYSPRDAGYFYATCEAGTSSIQLLDENTFATLSNFRYMDDQGVPDMLQFDVFYCPDAKKINPQAPGAAEYLGASFEGASSDGSIKYRMPAATYEGTPMIGEMSWKLFIDGKLNQIGTAQAGQEISIPVKGIAEGQHVVSLVAVLGSNAGTECVSNIYVGNDTPKAPANVKLTDKTIT